MFEKRSEAINVGIVSKARCGSGYQCETMGACDKISLFAHLAIFLHGVVDCQRIEARFGAKSPASDK